MYISVALSCPAARPVFGATGALPTVHLPACAVGAAVLSGGEVLRITRALGSGLPHAPLMCQVPGSKGWQNGGKLPSDAFEPASAVPNYQEAF